MPTFIPPIPSQFSEKNTSISSCTFMPSSQEIHRSPRVRKQATAWRARWWIQPSSRSWTMIASIHGYPV